jgi:hypothetical protein
MAKKNYQVLTDVWDAKIEKLNGEKVRLTVTGFNSNKTEVKVTAVMHEYFIKYLNRDIMTVAKRKHQEGYNFLTEIKNQVNQ